jgi:hypothetical protein
MKRKAVRPDAYWRRARPGSARTAVTIIAAALALLASACGGGSQAGSGGSPTAAGSPNSPPAVAYSACMRSHGVPNYPDPGSSGLLPKGDAQQFGVSAPQYQAAQQACQPVLPTGGSIQQQDHLCMQNSDCPPALVQQMMAADLKLARCMRAHGVPNFPDPTNGGPSGPVFDITKAGISDSASHTEQFTATLTECGRQAGANAPESFE